MRKIIKTVWKSGRDNIGMVLVETEFHICGYIAVVSGLSEKKDAEHVSEWGTYLTYKEACGIFGKLDKNKYKIN